MPACNEIDKRFCTDLLSVFEISRPIGIVGANGHLDFETVWNLEEHLHIQIIIQTTAKGRSRESCCRRQ